MNLREIHSHVNAVMPTLCPPPGPLPLGGGVNGYLTLAFLLTP